MNAQGMVLQEPGGQEFNTKGLPRPCPNTPSTLETEESKQENHETTRETRKGLEFPIPGRLLRQVLSNKPEPSSAPRGGGGTGRWEEVHPLLCACACNGADRMGTQTWVC